MSHECSRCDKKSQTLIVVDKAALQVWYCQTCDTLDIETYKPVAALFQVKPQ